ncbi:hypothetical protein BGW38_007768 [Lunasporangiospora selenospora]|uniref:CBM21 domain-containing protein n=1 Tax=Lunasporangiospora selenospora TaxID=979761 RepID=A0A9P6FK85_9FUNG|nr:hypothetical protein BGW38_007768 [Lunasporangiospora selenospora]
MSLTSELSPVAAPNPDRVLLRAIPHPLAATNKKVTLSLRRPAPPQHQSHSAIQKVTTSYPQPRIHHPNSTHFATTTMSVAAARVLESPTHTVVPTAEAKPAALFLKNGLPLKSAMKSPRSPPASARLASSRGTASPVTLNSPKYVHFNTQLEHVRLFLQGEMPSCVAERETIVDARQDGCSTSNIQLTLSNWSEYTPSAFGPVNIDSGAAPLRIEKVALSAGQTELQGTILVQNIAFHKNVTVRYTSNFWQSHSETRAEFAEAAADAALDRFSFVVPLDMDRTTIEKTFCFAICYQVIGREFWDSNNGMNYQVECRRVVVVPSQPPLSNLTKKMNSLLIGTPLPDYGRPVLKKKLANRYDFSTSLSAAFKNPIAATATSVNTPATAKSELASSSPKTLGAAFDLGMQASYRPSEYISPPLPPHSYHQSLYASSPKFITPYLNAASPPEHLHLGFDAFFLNRAISNSPVTNKRGMRANQRHGPGVDSAEGSPSTSAIPIPTRPQYASGYYASSPISSAPITIPLPRSHSNLPAVGSSSYYDLVDRYCFYESSPNISPYSSYPNSPPAPCIRG